MNFRELLDVVPTSEELQEVRRIYHPGRRHIDTVRMTPKGGSGMYERRDKECGQWCALNVRGPVGGTHWKIAEEAFKAGWQARKAAELERMTNAFAKKQRKVDNG